MENKKLQIKEIIKKNPLLSAREIGKLVGLHRCTVNWYIRSLGIYRDRETIRRSNNTKRSFEITISDNAEQIILGSILGDGMISKWNRNKDSKKNLNSHLVIQHTEPQKEYIFYKKKLLEENGIRCQSIKVLSGKVIEQKYKSVINGIELKSSSRYTLCTRRAITFNKYRDLFYNPTKYVNRYIYKLKALGLAIWFMDDGSSSNNRYFLYTNCFDKKSIILLQSMLKHNFNIITSVNKGKNNQYILYIKAESRELFTSIITPYICDSMRYKLIQRL